MTRLVAIMGATATGKTGVAIRLAEAFGGEIVSMDSRQVYRGLDIGTAKPSLEERRRVPHHLLDVLDPGEANSAGRHARLAEEAVADISKRRRLPILSGGTGLYIRAFFHGLIDARVPDEELGAIRRDVDRMTTPEMHEELSRIDPTRAQALPPSDRLRISRAIEVYLATGVTPTEHFAAHTTRGDSPADDDSLRIVLTLPRAILRERIATRTEAMYRAGWVREVRDLLDKGWTVESPAMNSLGYREIAQALHDGMDPKATGPRVMTLTQQYAKRQETFFRGMNGALWIDMARGDAVNEILRRVRAFPGRPEV
jgi:tRNA dimethylallyltransferase